MAKFETGPQVGMFRQGGDNQASIQGAEIPGKFFSGRRSQVEDVKSLKRLIGDVPELMKEMKSYAVTEGYGTANQAGDLTTKFTDWLLSRSGANKGLFSDQELATLKEVGKAVKRSFDAENLGRVANSDTAQKLESLNNLGLLDNKAVDFLAKKIPLVRDFSSPMLSGLKATAATDRNNILAKYLANPDEFSKALKQGSPKVENALTKYLSQPEVQQLGYRVAPQLISR